MDGFEFFEFLGKFPHTFMDGICVYSSRVEHCAKLEMVFKKMDEASGKLMIGERVSMSLLVLGMFLWLVVADAEGMVSYEANFSFDPKVKSHSKMCWAI